MSGADWDTRYLQMARLVGSWSKDPGAHVGAVIVRNNRVVATGFNGLPSEVLDTDERLDDPALKLEMTVHAEENALIVAGRSAEGASIYVHGRPVCCRCAGSIIQAGITRVVAMPPENFDPKSKWYQPGMLAREMFSETEIKFWGKEPETNEEISDSYPPARRVSKKSRSSARLASSVRQKSTNRRTRRG